MKLPLPDPTADMKLLRGAPWHIRNWTNVDRATIRDDTLRITHKPNTVGMKSGSGFHCHPFEATTRVVLSYDVFFPDGFDWVKGGKLPGLGIGPGREAATGGHWSADCGSFRVMWRERGQAIGYLYLPLHISPNKKRDGTIRIQKEAFERAATERALGKPAGIDLWFHAGEPMFFKRGKWNSVRMEVRLNTTGAFDGLVKLSINDETRVLDDVLIRKRDDIRINMMIFASFFGGNSAEWGAKKAETISYRDFSVDAKS